MQSDLLAKLPPLPDSRSVSVNEDYVCDGRDTFDRSANAVDNGTALDLNAGADELAWGIWGWDASGDDLISLGYDVVVPPGQAIYFAIANYAEQRWEIHGPLTDDEQYALDDTKHKSPMESVYCAALAYDASTPSCLTVTLTVDTAANEPPVAALVAWPETGKAPLTVELNAYNSDDGDGFIVDFEWDLNGDGNFNEPGDETDCRGDGSVDFTYDAEGDYAPQVRVTDDGGLTDTASASVSVGPPNVPPVADLQADPLDGATPLTVFFDAMASSDPDGTIVHVEWDFDNNGRYTEPGLEQEKDNYGNVGLIFYSAGSYPIGLRATDVDGATDFASVVITVSGNQAPVADLQADITEGDPPLAVSFDASGSSDPDGSIADYEWDLDGDQIFNEPGDELNAQGAPTTQYSYDAAGAYPAMVRVTDNTGGTDEATQTILAHGWVIVTVAPGAWCVGTSLCLVDGRPAISFTEYMDNELQFAVSSTALGAHPGDWSIITVDTANAGWVTSLALVDGNPAIAYNGYMTNDLLYARSSTAQGSAASDWGVATIDSAGETGFAPSLAVIDSRPAIAYFNRDNFEMMYALSASVTGGNAADWDFFAIGPGTGYDVWASLALIDGKPAIAFYEDGNSALQYAYSSTVDGGLAADWSNFIVDSTLLWCGEWCSLAQVAGKPAISYQGSDESSSFLRYAVSSSAQGAAPGDWTKLTVDSESGFGGSYTSIAEVGGKPAIAYSDDGLGVLKYAVSSTATGDNAADWSYEVADSSPISGEDASLAEINGYPAMSYVFYDMVADELRYAILLQ